MTLTVRLLGVEVLHVTTERDPESGDRGDCMTTAVGFDAGPSRLPIREPERDLT